MEEDVSSRAKRGILVCARSAPKLAQAKTRIPRFARDDMHFMFGSF
jgi:hypothetical protein